jgi:isoquinoline 1-oxidoreductase
MNADLSLDFVPEPERYEWYERTECRFDLDRRAFFKLVGGGVVVALLLQEAPAQQPGRGRGRFGGEPAPQELGAWLHVGEDGSVTVFTGKVELGQNIRTSLTQAVAEELRAPVASIQLVMADTGRVPFDGGTAGSQTTPRMAPQLRRVGAAAREVLLDLAAEQLKATRGTLVLADGKVTDPATKKALGLGELTKGKRLLSAIGSNAHVTAPEDWKVAGQPVAKVNGRDIVTGKHRYASDVRRPGMLFGKVLRAPAREATLTSVDTRAAEALPGVVVVHDGAFVGVAAPDEQQAERALAAVRAEWKTTSGQPSSQELFEYLKANAGGAGGFGGGGGFGRGGGGNSGSVAKGLAEADHKLEATYTVTYIAHAPLEPRAAVAEWDGGKVTVWTGTQRPFGVRGELADALGVPAERVRVIVPDTGSGYGGKHTGEAAVEAARLAKAAGKPVKVAWTREEEFTLAYFRPAGVIEVKGGARKDGTLTAWEQHNWNSGGSSLQTPYEVANRRAEAHGSRSPLRQGSYRALAATANTFARESHMDDLAHALGMDPLAFRLKNLKDERLRAVFEAAAQQFGWGKTTAADGHGFGIAGGIEKGSYVASCAEVAVDRDSGRVKVVRVVTAFDCGAVVNPGHLKNQVEGAVVMGLGGALFEAIRFADGKVLNPRFSQYRVPRFADLPALEAVLIDRKNTPSAGAGETPIIAVAPAVGNALFAATRVRRRALPLVPDGGKL